MKILYHFTNYKVNFETIWIGHRWRPYNSTNSLTLSLVLELFDNNEVTKISAQHVQVDVEKFDTQALLDDFPMEALSKTRTSGPNKFW